VVSVAIAVSVAIWKNRSNAEIAFHNTAKTRFGQLKNLSNAAVSSQIGHILNPWLRSYGTVTFCSHIVLSTHFQHGKSHLPGGFFFPDPKKRQFSQKNGWSNNRTHTYVEDFQPSPSNKDVNIKHHLDQ